jgi:hypothetical protein
LDLARERGVEAVHRLVQDQHAGVAQQGRRDADALAHAERELAEALRGDRTQTRELQNFVHPARRNAMRGGEDPQMVAGAAARMARLGVQQDPDFGERGGRGRERAAVDHRRARCRPLQTDQEPHGRGLARPVGAEEPRDPTGRDRDRQIIDSHFLAEAFGEIPGLDHEDLLEGGRRCGFTHDRASTPRQPRASGVPAV